MNERITGGVFTVFNMPGEPAKSGLFVASRARFIVVGDGVEVGRYRADMVVERTILVELKAVKHVGGVRLAQCFSLLTTTNLPVRLLLNFGTPRLQIKRFVGAAAR